MGNPDPSQIGTLQAIMHIGSLAGGIPAALVADRWGRKPAMILGCMIEIVGVVISTSHNYATFLVGRFILGMGVNLCLTVGPAWTSELAHPRQRGVISSCYNVLWYVGAIFSAWISFGTSHIDSTWAWRIPSMVQAVSPIMILTFAYWVPESPRFLLAKDRIEEGRTLLARLHANGNESDELVEFEVVEIATTLKMEAEVNKTGWNVLWSTRANLRRTLIACSLPLIVLWSGQGKPFHD
jgi:MFS family permease